MAGAIEDGGSTGAGQTNGGSSTGQATGGSGTGQSDNGGPRISCTPTSIPFGEVPADNPVSVPVVCTNVGASDSTPALIIDPPQASPSVFMAHVDSTIESYPPGGLEPGQSARIDVSYAPTTASSDQGALVIKSNGGDDISVVLSGQGFPLQPCRFMVSAKAIDFGSVQPGSTSQPMSLEIQNLGTGVCVLQDLGIEYDATDSFHILSTNLQPDPLLDTLSLAPPDAGATSSLVVTLDFAPSTFAAALSADAVVSVLDPSGTDRTVSVSLSGAASNSDETHCLQIPSSLGLGGVVWPRDAGVTDCTSAGSPTLTFVNNCTTSVTILSFTLQSTSGDLAPQFTLPSGPALPLTLAGGSAAAIYEIFFEPTSAGSHTSQLVVAHNSQDSAAVIESTISLSARTVPPPTETDSFVATSSLSYPLVGAPLFESGITVTINATPVAHFDGPNQPDWTYDATDNAIVFTPRVYLMAGQTIDVTYPIGCK